jgi:hypothetical protein
MSLFFSVIRPGPAALMRPGREEVNWRLRAILIPTKQLKGAGDYLLFPLETRQPRSARIISLKELRMTSRTRQDVQDMLSLTVKRRLNVGGLSKSIEYLRKQSHCNDTFPRPKRIWLLMVRLNLRASLKCIR